MQHHTPAGECAASREKEHRDAEEQLTQFSSLPVDSDEWLTGLVRLRELIAQHVAVEEAELFEVARETFSAHELKSMNEHYEERRERELRALGFEPGADLDR